MGVRIRSGWTAADPPQILTDRVASPLAVVHGRRDTLIPVRWGLELQLRADSRRYVVLAHDMGHAFDPKGRNPESVPPWIGLLRRNVILGENRRRSPPISWADLAAGPCCVPSMAKRVPPH